VGWGSGAAGATARALDRIPSRFDSSLAPRLIRVHAGLSALVLAPLLRRQLLRMQTRIAAVFTAPLAAEQPVLGTLELRTALDAFQLGWGCSPTRVDALSRLRSRHSRVASTQHARHHEFHPDDSFRFGRTPRMAETPCSARTTAPSTPDGPRRTRQQVSQPAHALRVPPAHSPR
jgi:hypothetical protein